ncbi:nascent polypeptide-associated complex subunit alpha, muscle-specific form isoform X2 [Procambarus clarkii]|uniref:nascent polypeptide-associated complex subunit alpha, muscle-specific form isoform X2 n=1 Tax=Procambarus clarkii TaxID=6728 RepID=UPI003742B10F
MTTMQGYISGQEAPLDELPSWKRELILRKRANARIHGGFGLAAPAPPMAGRGRGLMSGPGQPAPSSSLSGPGQPVSPCSLSGPGQSVPLSSLSGPHHPAASCSLSGPHHPAGARSLSGPLPSHPHPPSHANNSAVSSRLDGGCATVSGGDDGSQNHKYVITGEIASVSVSSMHHKGLYDEGPRVTSPTYSTVSDSYAQEDEELRYGPGIVSKLKNRYMSLAMRESRSRPSLRRFSSLEDLLDTEPRETWQERGISDAKPRAAPVTAVSHRREVMRRARSVDSLSCRLTEDSARIRTPGLPKSRSATSRLQSSLCALGKDDVIIIETSKPAAMEQKAVNGAGQTVDAGEPPPLTRRLSSSSLVEEEDMPAPDTVRQVKRLFEAPGNRPLRGTAARVAAHKAAQSSKANGVAIVSKPALKVKPIVMPARIASPPSSTHSITIEEAKSSLKKVAQVTRPSPRATLSVRATALNGDATASTHSGQEILSTVRARPGLTPVSASVTAPMVNGDPGPRQAQGESLSAFEVEEGVRRVSNIAVSNIRKESQSQEFNFTNRPANTPSAQLAAPKLSSPTPTPLPASPVASHRVPAHTPFSSKGERAQESELVHRKNLKNAESRPQTSPVEPPQTKLPSPTNVESPKQTKVEPNKSAPKVELYKPPPKVEPQKPSPKKVESKPEVVTPVKSEPIKPTPSPVDLVRSPNKGSLVEAFNTTNKPPLANVGGNSPGSTPITTKTASHRDRWNQHDATTLVFNFTSSKKETPDYIENDGVDLSRRPEQLDSGYVIMPGWEGRADSSTDGDDLDDSGLDYLDSRPGVLPAPSGIVFEGEAVIINGRSNLQRQPKTKKLSISFDDALTSTFEYPSELFLLAEAGLLPLDPPAAAPTPPTSAEAANITSARGGYRLQRPMVTGTSSVTIHVLRAYESSSLGCRASKHL